MSTFHIHQFGCRATQADGAALERQLRDLGYSATATPHSAEIVVLNTCTVTAAADAQARDAIRKIHTQNPGTKIIVTGCYAQRAPEELAALPGVTHVVGNSHKPQISSLITKLSVAPQPVSSLISIAPAPEVPANPSAEILTGDIFSSTTLLAAPVLGGEGNHTRPTLKIQDGCNLRCSYCVIPFVRGKSRSLPPQTVIAEIQSLVASGFKEIVLSGINLGMYGRDLSPKFEFEDLLRQILDETKLDRLRISSIEPLDVTQDLIELFASTDRIAEHFHMPLQSASDRILAAMHRWYRAEHYARRVELIHERLPHAAIGADVITGFPGETDDDHAATMEFIDRLPFTYLHVFSYSQRPGTQAAALPNQIPPHIIKQRARQLRALSAKKSAAFRASQSGRTLRALTLHRKENSPVHTTPALTSNYLQIEIPGTPPANTWIESEIVEESKNGLRANTVTLRSQTKSNTLLEILD